MVIPGTKAQDTDVIPGLTAEEGAGNTKKGKKNTYNNGQTVTELMVQTALLKSTHLDTGRSSPEIAQNRR